MNKNDDSSGVHTPVYMDFNATTPVCQNVIKEMLPYFSEKFGNPSSSHIHGESAKNALQKARTVIAKLLEANPNSIFFTSGATESLNWAIKCGAINKRKQLIELKKTNKSLEKNLKQNKCETKEKYKIVSCQTEHVAVLNILSFLQNEYDFIVEYIPVDISGHILLNELKQILTKNTVLVSIPYADGEVGAIQLIKQIVKIVRNEVPNALFHTDASQAIGKTRVSVSDIDVDLLSVAGHKIYAPKGIGCLYIKEGVSIDPLIIGGGQQNGLRGGTENVAYCVALAKACEIIFKNLDDDIIHFSKTKKILKESFIQTLINLTKKSETALQEYFKFNSGENCESYLPNTISISVKNAKGTQIVASIKDQLCISAGASCHRSEESMSNVLKAMQIPFNFGIGTIRLSTGRFTTTQEAIFAGETLAKKLIELRLVEL